MKPIICLGAGRNQLKALSILNKLGYPLITVDFDKNAPGHSFANHSIISSTHEPDPIYQELLSIGSFKQNCQFFNKSSGIPILTTAILARNFSVDFVDPAFADLIIRKNDIKHFLSNNNINVPVSFVTVSPDSFKTACFPYILKPDFSPGGKKDVYFVDSIDHPLVDKICSELIFSEYVIEQFIDGRDFTLFGAVKCSNFLPLYILEEHHNVLSDGKITVSSIDILSLTNHQRLLSSLLPIAHQITSLLSLKKCFASFSFRVPHIGQPHFIEMHLDVGGDFVLDHLLEFSSENKSPIESIFNYFYSSSEMFSLASSNLKIRDASMCFDVGDTVTNDFRHIDLNYI